MAINETTARMLKLLEDIHRGVKSGNKKLDKLAGSEALRTIDFSTLIAKVTDAAGVDQSIKTLVEGIASELELQPGLQALSKELRESGDALKAAVVANTPSS